VYLNREGVGGRLEGGGGRQTQYGLLPSHKSSQTLPRVLDGDHTMERTIVVYRATEDVLRRSTPRQREEHGLIEVMSVKGERAEALASELGGH
jgi:hypothetical protein